VISDGRELEEGNFEPGFQWRPLSVDAIEVPVNLSAVVEIVVAQQSEMMAADIVGLVDDFQSLGWQMRSQQVGAFLRAMGREKEFGLARWRFVKLNRRWWYAHPIK